MSKDHNAASAAQPHPAGGRERHGGANASSPGSHTYEKIDADRTIHFGARVSSLLFITRAAWYPGAISVAFVLFRAESWR